MGKVLRSDKFSKARIARNFDKAMEEIDEFMRFIDELNNETEEIMVLALVDISNFKQRENWVNKGNTEDE